IVAAGRGTRMGANVDKLFLEVAGRPIVAHTWSQLDDLAEISEIILVVRDGMQEAFAGIGKTYRFTRPFRFVSGGVERPGSAWNGLQALSPAADIVVVQDGARPCTSPELVRRTVAAARQGGAAVAAQRVTDTIKESEDGARIQRTLDRSRLWAV